MTRQVWRCSTSKVFFSSVETPCIPEKSVWKTILKIPGLKFILPAFWLARRFRSVQSVQTSTFGPGIWKHRAVFVSTVLRGHFWSLDNRYLVLLSWISVRQLQKSLCHGQLNDVTIELISSFFCTLPIIFQKKAATGSLVPARIPETQYTRILERKPFGVEIISLCTIFA